MQLCPWTNKCHAVDFQIVEITWRTGKPLHWAKRAKKEVHWFISVFTYLLLNKNAASIIYYFYTQVSQLCMEKVFELFSTVKSQIFPLTSLIKPKAKQPRHRTQDVYIHQLVEQLREFWDDYKEDLNIPQHRPALSLAATQLLQVHRDHRRNDPWHKSVPNPNCLQVAPGPRQTSVRFISSCQCRVRCFEEYISMDINGLSWCICRSNLETN